MKFFVRDYIHLEESFQVSPNVIDEGCLHGRSYTQAFTSEGPANPSDSFAKLSLVVGQLEVKGFPN